MYPKSPGPTFSHGPSLVSKARHTQPSRLARGPAPFPSRGGILRHRPACLLKRFRSQGSQTICAFRWPPQAPPHCAAVQATQRPARHRWRRCQATPAPPCIMKFVLVYCSSSSQDTAWQAAAPLVLRDRGGAWVATSALSSASRTVAWALSPHSQGRDKRRFYDS